MNNDPVISLKEALKLMEASLTSDGAQKPFDISFIKFSNHDKTDNGSIVEYTGCIKCGLPRNSYDTQRKAFQILATKQIKSFNIFLLVKFNGKLVKW
jgi:hypothetical protein